MQQCACMRESEHVGRTHSFIKGKHDNCLRVDESQVDTLKCSHELFLLLAVNDSCMRAT